MNFIAPAARLLVVAALTASTLTMAGCGGSDHVTRTTTTEQTVTQPLTGDTQTTTTSTTHEKQ